MSRPNAAAECLVVAQVSPQRGLRHVRTEGAVTGRATRRYMTELAMEPGTDGMWLFQAWIVEYEGAVWPLGPWAVVFRWWDDTKTLKFDVRPVVSMTAAIDLIANTYPYDKGQNKLLDSDGHPHLAFSAHPTGP